MPVRARVKLLSDGAARLETMKAALEAGPTAVLTFDNFTVVVLSRTVSLFDRAMYFANGLDPRDFDLIVVKSPHTEHHMYDSWGEKNFNIDVARRHLGQPDDARPHDLRAADLPARRKRDFHPTGHNLLVSRAMSALARIDRHLGSRCKTSSPSIKEPNCLWTSREPERR